MKKIKSILRTTRGDEDQILFSLVNHKLRSSSRKVKEILLIRTTPTRQLIISLESPLTNLKLNNTTKYNQSINLTNKTKEKKLILI